MKLRVDGRNIDFRLSVMPSVDGEDAVVRVLDRAMLQRQGPSIGLADLGYTDDDQAALLSAAQAPHGMVLVTGPTGSGKTTTLYALLEQTRRADEKIVTIEDPVEYRLPGVVQIPVNERKGLTFARGLRSILRHDPDRVMVGEVRDAETAQIAVQAALTGHLVLSTVHANGVFDVVARFLHMGLDAHHLVSALHLVIAQRLVRRVCRACAGPDAPDAGVQRELDAVDLGVTGLSRGHGCPACRHTGYRGRLALAEILRLDDVLRDLIAGRAPLTALKDAARVRGWRALRTAGLHAVADGHTTFEELRRVTLES